MWITLLSVAIAIISVSVLIGYRRQIHAFNEQLKLIRKYESNKLITQDMGFREIDELVVSLNELIKAHRLVKVEYMNKDKNLKEMVTNLSHDIRTPLTSLDGYFQLLLVTDSEEKKSHYAKIINGRIQTLSDLLEQLFMYLKIENNSYDLPMESYNINRLLYDSMFSFYEEFTSKNMEPIIQIPEEHIYVNLNKAAFYRVMQNMIKNALVHGEGYFVLSSHQEGNQIVIQCKNSYSKQEQLDVTKIFERFYKADEARSYTSTGLGLSIAQKLVMKMNGTIEATIESEEGKDILCITQRYKIWKRLTKV